MIVSIHMGNVDGRILEAQRTVFKRFGFVVNQIGFGCKHGEAMDQILETAASQRDPHLLFVDIDCIPLSYDAIHEAISMSWKGILHGAMGHANHIPASDVYVHPCWMAISPQKWVEAGKPTCKAGNGFDTAANVTARWQELGWPVSMTMPLSFEVPKWKLPHGLPFGIGTTYGGECYHLYQGSSNEHTERFLKKAQEVMRK